MVYPLTFTQSISIHAPRTGSDKEWVFEHYNLDNFNPRSPHGERRKASNIIAACRSISIHAPRTGSDCAK